MKKLFTFLVLISNLTFGQNNDQYEENLNIDFLTYNTLILNQEFEKAMEYMLPDFFDIIPRSQLISLMNQIYNDPEIEFEANPPQDIVYSEPKRIEGKYYSEIKYSNDFQIKFTTNDIKDEEQRATLQKITKLQLEKTFGSENVYLNQETGFYKIHTRKIAYGVSENGISKWKFIVVEPEQKYIWEKILPKKIIEAL